MAWKMNRENKEVLKILIYWKFYAFKGYYAYIHEFPKLKHTNADLGFLLRL